MSTMAILTALLLSLCGSAFAAPSGLYRGKSDAYLDMQIPLPLEAAKKCILDQVYANAVVTTDKRSIEETQKIKSGGKPGELVSWGKKIYESAQFTAGEGVTRVFLQGSSVSYPDRFSAKGLFKVYEPCLKGNVAGNILKLSEPSAPPPAEIAFSESSKLSSLDVAQCLAAYPRDTSSDYENYYVVHQSRINPDGSIYMGWYFSGSFNIAPAKRFYSYLIEPAGTGAKVSLALRNLSKNDSVASVKSGALGQLALSCALDGTSRRVTGWPRSTNWKP